MLFIVGIVVSLAIQLLVNHYKYIDNNNMSYIIFKYVLFVSNCILTYLSLKFNLIESNNSLLIFFIASIIIILASKTIY